MKCEECGNIHEFYETKIVAHWFDEKRTEVNADNTMINTIYCNDCGSDKVIEKIQYIV